MNARRAQAFGGDVLDTRAACPDLSIAEEAIYEALVARAKAQVAGEATRVRDVWLTKTAKEQAREMHLPVDVVRAKLERMFHGDLTPEFPLVFDDASKGKVTVADVLRDPDMFVGETLRDPEDDERGQRAIVYRGYKDGRLFIKSFARGDAYYNLVHNFATLKQLIDDAEKEDVDAIMEREFPHADLSKAEEFKISDAARAKAGFDKDRRRWDRLMKPLIEKRAQRHGKPDDLGDPTIPSLTRPFDDAPLNATLQPLDDVLCAVQAPEPPFRSLWGHYAVIVERTFPEIMHRLASSEAQPREQWLPPPPITTIHEADNSTLISDIERYVRFVKIISGDPPMIVPVRLQSMFAQAYQKWLFSRLPVVEAVLTLPVVMGGKLVGAVPGLNRKMRRIFRVPKALLDRLPQSPVTLDVARKSYEALGAMLKDVAFKDRKKDLAKSIAFPLTIIQRHLFDQRPGFLVTGDMPGGGKTTLLNMLVAMVTARYAAAAAYDKDPTERRKVLFPIGLIGVACVVFDNMERGTEIDCEYIAKALTGVAIEDRVLGGNEWRAVLATMVLAFNGNRIGAKGDLAQRIFKIEIDSPGRNPFERNFAHDLPVDWMIENYSEALVHLFSILMVERQPVKPKTRFKAWYTHVGHALELASGVDLAQDMSENVDVEEMTRTRIVAQLYAWRKQKDFTASEVVAELLPNEDGRTQRHMTRRQSSLTTLEVCTRGQARISCSIQLGRDER
jgi:hypothetical protein